jgi:tellurite methyltransferase
MKGPMSQAADENLAGRWDSFLRNTRTAAAHGTLRQALEGFAREGAAPSVAFDLGCGAGRDSLEMLRRGWRVVAVDYYSAGLEMLQAAATGLGKEVAGRLECRCERMEAVHLPPGGVRLVNASLALPFCAAEHLAEVWSSIARGLPAGGRFAGHFFGPEGTFVKEGLCIALTRDGVQGCLADFDVEVLEEIRDDAPDGGGKTRHWHVFDVVGRKK